MVFTFNDPSHVSSLAITAPAKTVVTQQPFEFGDAMSYPSQCGFSFFGAVADYAASITTAVSEEMAQLRQDISSDLQCMFTDDDREFFRGAAEDRDTIQEDFLVR